MTAMTTATFTAARVQGRYRVLDEAGQIVVTLNSKAKAEARAAELNDAALTVEHADNMEQIDAALAVLDTATEESDAEIVARQDAEEAQVLADAAEEERRNAVILAELDAQAAARAAEERQETPQGDTGTSDTPAAPEAPEKPAKTVKPKADQPAPHAFTTVGTKVKNHCTDCGRSWAAASHRKFREQAPTAEVVTDEEWTPAEDDTTETGKAPAEEAQAASA